MFNIGICGYGTVGQSLVKHLTAYKKNIQSNTSQKFSIGLIADRSIDSKEYDKSIPVTKNPMDLVSNPDIHIIVELLGGIGLSYELIVKAIKNQKHIVTANKALIAVHGDEIFKLAYDNNVYFGFEASVAGAIPVISTLTKSMANEEIFSFVGIINGTCNYILEQMTCSDLSFDDALQNAKKLGYAEADPTFDINGTDAAHKISILASIVHKVMSPLEKTYIEGIENITSMDIKYARELGYSIKHVGVSNKNNNMLECSAYPVLLPLNNILSQVNGVMNAILIKGDKFGKSMLYGHGAGGEATASAVVANIIEAINYASKTDLTNQLLLKSMGTKKLDIKNNNEVVSPFYLRIYAEDISGVMAEITNILANQNISIEAGTQHEPTSNNSLIPIVMITNVVSTNSIKNAINKIQSLDHVIGDVHIIRVLKNDE